MAQSGEGARNPKPQDQKNHAGQWERDPNPGRPAGKERQSSSENRNEVSEEEMDKTLADSFPASDPPSWNMGKDRSRSPATGPKKVRIKLTEESRELLARHFKQGTALQEVLNHAARSEVAGVAVYAFECAPSEAETLLEMARNHCPSAVKDIEPAIAAAR
jgi:hypothetical protein